MIEVTAGFAEPAINSQQIFRTVMMALARPAQPLALPAVLAGRPPAPLTREMATILLTLADFETTIWLDAPLANSAATIAFLKFHTGARLTTEPKEAHFAAVSDPAAISPLSQFAFGSPENPERSTTVLVDVAAFTPVRWQCQGPGIERQVPFGAGPLPAHFLPEWQANCAHYPLGVDLLLMAPGAIAGLPRTTRLSEG